MNVSYHTAMPDRYAEETSVTLTGVLRDDAGAVLPVASIGTLTLSLYDKASGSIVNSRTAQDIKNVNGGTVDANGLLTMKFGPLDTVMLNPAETSEIRVALFTWTYNAGAAKGRAEVEFTVMNLTKVP